MHSRQYNTVFHWLLSSVFLEHLSLNIVYPLLTLVCFDANSTLFAADTSFAVRSMWYGLMMSAYHLSSVITGPLLGIFSDYCGRRLILLLGAIGALLMALSGVVGVCFGVIAILLLGRFIGGLCSTRAVSQAAVSDLSSHQAKLSQMAALQASIALAAFLGPLLSGYMAQYGHVTFPFGVAAVAALMSLAIVICRVSETHRQRDSYRVAIVWHNMKQVLRKPAILKISACLFLSQISWSFYYQYMPPILKHDFHFSAAQIGVFISLIALWLTVAASIGMKWLQRFGSEMTILRFASWLTLVGVLLSIMTLYWHQSQYLLWLASAMVAVGDVLAYCVFTTWYGVVAEAQRQGLVMGVCLAVAQLVWFITGLVGGWLLGLSTLLPLAAALVGVASLLLVLGRKQNI